MYLVAGVTGNTGSVVAATLLDAGARVRVLVRSEEKGAPWKARGAEVAVGRVDVADDLSSALAGTQGAYLLVPPDMRATDQLARARRIVDVMVESVRRSAVPHVVLLSSIGAQHASGTGPIQSVARAESLLGSLDVALTAVRAAYFVENFGSVLHPVLGDGVLPAFFDPTLAIPMVATRDIGRVAAEALLAGPRSRRVLELAGPKELSHADVAATFSKLLGREVRVVPVPPEARRAALVGAGVVDDLAGLFAQMQGGLESGRVAWERTGTESVRGTVDHEEVLAPMVKAALGARG